MRFFYYYPTWNKPSGGNKQLRLQAALLRELGVETFLLRDRMFYNGDRFDDDHFYGVPVEMAPVAFEDAGSWLLPDDVLVLPEVILEKSLSVCGDWSVRLAVNNQNGFYGLRYMPLTRLGDRIEFAVSNAPYVTALCERYYGLRPQRVFEIPLWILRPPFELPQTEKDRVLAVAYMPRKLPEVVARVSAEVRRRHPDVPWVEIDGLTEAQVAERFHRCWIFFATQDLEGFGLPAVEAMACGCLVAGFAGTGKFPHPYAEPGNGLWAPDRDVAGAVAVVGRAIELARAGGEQLHSYVEAGRRTVLRYTCDTSREGLRELALVVADRSYAMRRVSAARLDWRARLFTFRLLYDYDRLGWRGRVLSWAARVTKPVRRAFQRTLAVACNFLRGIRA